MLPSQHFHQGIITHQKGIPMSAIDFTPLLTRMVHEKASDLFITAGVPPSLKVYGRVAPFSKTPLTPAQTHAIAYSIMSIAQRQEFEASSECNFAIQLECVGRFRANVFRQQGHVGMVVRRIETAIPTLDQLRLPPALKELMMVKRGLVIMVGATGSGKSTSLAAMIGHRNRHSSGHIVTIEDPVEFIHKHDGCIVTQREVGLDTQTFEAALKNSLRQAPDVIAIGEIRSREIMEHALAFAETGHLCLATLHASNANQALDRILNFFPKDRRDQVLMDLSMSLKAVLAQRLVPGKNGKGRRLAAELLINTPLISDLILRGEHHLIKGVMKKSGQHHMITFDQALYELYVANEISDEDALQHADSVNELRLMIKRGTRMDTENLPASVSEMTLEHVEPAASEDTSTPESDDESGTAFGIDGRGLLQRLSGRLIR